MTYVLDGGILLQRLPLQNEVTYNDLCQSYVDYSRRKYDTTIIEKDMTHLRRTRCTVSAQVNFNRGITLKSTKEHLLTSHLNREQAEVHYK